MEKTKTQIPQKKKGYDTKTRKIVKNRRFVDKKPGELQLGFWLFLAFVFILAYLGFSYLYFI